MRIWSKTKEFSEGKYLVVRRDGTIPRWPHFVIGGDDPAGPAALMAYAAAARALGLDNDYCASIEELATDFRKRAADAKTRTLAPGEKRPDPDQPPHRADNPAVIAIMRNPDLDLTNYKGE